MAWQLYTEPSTGILQWIDPDRAAGWFQTAANLSSPAAQNILKGQDWNAQLNAVTAAWKALAYGLQALNLPAYAQPIYRDSYAQWARTPQGGILAQRISAWWPTIGGTPFDAANPLCGVILRLTLDASSNLVTQCVSPLGLHDPNCDFGAVWSGCSNAPGLQGCQSYNWFTLAWDNPPSFGIAAGPICRVTRCSPPLVWFMEWVSQVASQYAQLGPIEVLRQGIGWATVSNLIQARAAGLLPADLANTTARVAADYAAITATGRTEIGAALDVIAAGIGLITANPAVGAVLAGAFTALASILPIASACQTDFWGRCVPAFEPLAISGNTAQGIPPSQIVPDPPGMAPAVSPPTDNHVDTLGTLLSMNLLPFPTLAIAPTVANTLPGSQGVPSIPPSTTNPATVPLPTSSPVAAVHDVNGLLVPPLSSTPSTPLASNTTVLSPTVPVAAPSMTTGEKVAWVSGASLFVGLVTLAVKRSL